MTFAFRYLDEKSGQKSLIKAFLSVEIWQPLQKLTFLMYMFHPIIGRWYLKDVDIPMYYAVWQAIMYLCGLVVVVAACSFVLYIFMEQPMALLISAVMKRVLGGRTVPKRMSLQRAPSRLIHEMKHHPSTGTGSIDVEPSPSHSDSDSDINDETDSEEEADELTVSADVEVMKVQS